MKSYQKRPDGTVVEVDLPDPEPREWLSPYDAVALFTVQELAAINGSSDLVVVQLRERIRAAVDIARQPLLDAVQYLQSVGLLTAERVSEVTEASK